MIDEDTIGDPGFAAWWMAFYDPSCDEWASKVIDKAKRDGTWLSCLRD